MVVPDGDRRHSTESGSVVNQKHTSVRNNNIVCIFVLTYDLGNKLRMHFALRFCCGPHKNLIETSMTIDFFRDLIKR